MFREEWSVNPANCTSLCGRCGTHDLRIFCRDDIRLAAEKAAVSVLLCTWTERDSLRYVLVTLVLGLASYADRLAMTLRFTRQGTAIVSILVKGNCHDSALLEDMALAGPA